MLKKIFEDKKLRADVILVASLLVVLLSVFIITSLNREEGNTVRVSIYNELVGEYRLDKDGEYALNGGTHVLKIEGGYVYMKEASCVGFQDCVMTGRISLVGDKIICLPYGITVEIVGEGDGLI